MRSKVRGFYGTYTTIAGRVLRSISSKHVSRGFPQNYFSPRRRLVMSCYMIHASHQLHIQIILNYVEATFFLSRAVHRLSGAVFQYRNKHISSWLQVFKRRWKRKVVCKRWGLRCCAWHWSCRLLLCLLQLPPPRTTNTDASSSSSLTEPLLTRTHIIGTTAPP